MQPCVRYDSECEEKGTGTSQPREFAVLGDGGSEPVSFLHGLSVLNLTPWQCLPESPDAFVGDRSILQG